MIQINLLDPASIKGGRASRAATKGAANAATAFSEAPRGGGGLLVPVVVALMLLVNGGFLYVAVKAIHDSNKAAEVAKAEENKLKAEIDKKMAAAEQIKKYREVVSNQMDVLKSLDPPDRILWCEKINMLANLIPQDVFLAEVKIDENVKMVETEQSKAAREKWAKSKTKEKTKEPPMVQKPVINYIVRLTGLALGKDNVEQMKNVTAFHRAITEYTYKNPAGKDLHFMDNFQNNIEFESVEATTYEGVPVNKFIFKLTTVPMGEDTPEEAAKKAGNAVASAKMRVSDLARSDAKDLALSK